MSRPPSALHGQQARPDGIVGLKGRVPVGVAITLKAKAEFGQKAVPCQFSLVVPRESNGVRMHHPAQAAFNTSGPEKRRMLRVTLVHDTPDEMFAHSLKAYRLKDHPTPPGKRPACEGNGEWAIRFIGEKGPDDFRRIPCPNDRCQYRVRVGRDKPPCGPSMLLIAQLRTTDPIRMPSMLAKHASGGWESVANVKGFFEHLGRVCSAASEGRGQISLIGFRALLSVQERTNPEKRARYPVVSLTPEDAPDEFVMRQQAAVKILPNAARIQDMTPEELAEDHLSLQGPMQKPGRRA